jgi:hypothetical protein
MTDRRRGGPAVTALAVIVVSFALVPFVVLALVRAPLLVALAGALVCSAPAVALGVTHLRLRLGGDARQRLLVPLTRGEHLRWRPRRSRSVGVRVPPGPLQVAVAPAAPAGARGASARREDRARTSRPRRRAAERKADPWGAWVAGWGTTATSLRDLGRIGQVWASVEADLVRVIEAGSAPKNVYSLLRRAWEHAERTGEFHMVDRRLDDSRADEVSTHPSRRLRGEVADEAVRRQFRPYSTLPQMPARDVLSRPEIVEAEGTMGFGIWRRIDLGPLDGGEWYVTGLAAVLSKGQSPTWERLLERVREGERRAKRSA